jgi:AraC family transcriptional regulator
MKDDTRSFYELAVQKAVERILSGLDHALDLQALARVAALSPFHFHRVFRGALGETPLELHRRLRLERAAHELLEGSMPVTTVAFAAGYETHESFTRAFREHYQCSPSDFRQSRDLDREGCARPRQIELPSRSGLHFQPGRSGKPEIHFTTGGPAMNVEIKELPERRIAAVTHVGPYNRISEAFGRLGEIAGRAGLIGPAPVMLGVYYDDPETTPAAELRSQAALVIAEDAKIPAELAEGRIPGGRYAVTTHIGPYEQLGDVWARFMGEWLPKSGHRVRDGQAADPVELGNTGERGHEIYRNTPADVPKEELVTELYIPLESSRTSASAPGSAR